MIRMTALAMGAALLVAAAPVKVDMPARILPPPAAPGEGVKPFVTVAGGRIALRHVRVIDGTGAPAQTDRTLLIDGARITAVQAGGDAVPTGYAEIDLTGRSVLPGLVGMHDHQFYIARPNLDASGHGDSPLMVPQMAFSSPRMYLAAGVTTLRTTGSVEPYTDLNMKRAIDAGTLPGPHMDVTAPYLEGSGSPFIQMHPLADAADATRTVNFWADQGVTSFKAYMNITRVRAARGGGRGACARVEGDGAFVFGQLPRGDRGGDRRSGARLLGQHAGRPGQGARHLPGDGRRADAERDDGGQCRGESAHRIARRWPMSR